MNTVLNHKTQIISNNKCCSQLHKSHHPMILKKSHHPKILFTIKLPVTNVFSLSEVFNAQLLHEIMLFA